MSWMKFGAFLPVVVFLCLFVGCESDSDSDSGGGSDSYAGTWTGSVCGRAVTISATQNGTTLSGTYTLSDPTFTEGFSGTVSSETPPATAVLNGGADRRFEVTFSSYSSLSGGYYKGATKVCDVSASK